MSLSSPRFLSNFQFVKVFFGRDTIRLGKQGSAVQIIQQALIDAGFDCGPSDGSFGVRTQRMVKELQRKHGIKEDGRVDGPTLTKIDNLLPGYQHKVKVHFRSINHTQVPMSRIIEKTKLIYAQYGIRIEMSSGQSLLLTEAQTMKFFSIKNSCEWEISSGEAFELHGMGGPVSPTDILVYYVFKFDSATLLGCGGHAKGRPAATVASKASQWDTAHEIGHVLLTSSYSPVHSLKKSNLMYQYSSTGNATPTLDNKQLTQMRRSKCCVPVTAA